LHDEFKEDLRILKDKVLRDVSFTAFDPFLF
jgi:hypothetical protein